MENPESKLRQVKQAAADIRRMRFLDKIEEEYDLISRTLAEVMLHTDIPRDEILGIEEERERLFGEVAMAQETELNLYEEVEELSLKIR